MVASGEISSAKIGRAQNVLDLCFCAYWQTAGMLLFVFFLTFEKV